VLVLSRKENQSIVIDENIKVVVLQIEGNKVRLGFEAPRDVPIHRREVEDRIRHQPPISVLRVTSHPATSSEANTARSRLLPR
jgi:carbon storage regulator